MTTQSKLRRMTVAEFLEWASAQPRGRYELVHGEVVRLSPETVGHNLTKGAVYVALDDAIKRAGLPYFVFGSGGAVVVDEEHVRDPDCSVQSKASTDLEVDDAGCAAHRRRGHLAVGARRYRGQAGGVLLRRQHPQYLIVNPVKTAVIHHARGQDGDIVTRIASSGEIDLTPPGMTVPVAELLPEIG